MAKPSDGLNTIMRIGYALVIISIGLMIWASSVGAVKTSDPPCVFNVLCTCSNGYLDNFGTVECVNVPFPLMPIAMNTSKIYALKMDSTGLTDVGSYFLQATGLYRLEITNNPVYEVSDDAFHGLERSLWELILKSNGLIEIPTKALRYLHKLRHLDLSGNGISVIERDSFRGLQSALETLILADNSITQIPIDAFHGLPNLNTLDLSSNNLHEITPDVFREQMNSLLKLNFADNLLKEIPYVPLAMLKSLRHLDLSSNRIEGFQVESEVQPLNIKLSLENLHLEHNEIHVIQPAAFQYFLTVNRTFLDFNPIHVVSDNAFMSARIRELYIRHCKLDFIEPAAFNGLESSLQILDISGNNITTLPETLFTSFDFLGHVNVRDNKMNSIFPQNGAYAAFQSDLYQLDLIGDRNGLTNLQDVKRLDKLRTLTVGKLLSNSLSPNDFIGFGVQLENLRINHAGLRSVKAHAFMHVRGIKKLDLSENSIDSIEKGAFQEIGHSLMSLKIAHGLSSQVTQLPDIHELTSLREIDLSNNRLKSISDTSFHFLKSLEILELNDNQIEQLQKGTFQRDIHQRLEEIAIEFNSLRHISTHTFVDLEKLHTIRLRDNRIERLERRAFMNLDKLVHLNLRGNKLSSISEEAFQNLPALELLDISYNSLKTFDFDYFDQVGTLRHLIVNASHNSIVDLTDNVTSFIASRDHDPCDSFISGSSLHHSSIKVLDLSNNNISKINPGYFKPAEMSLISLSLSYNSLMNTSRDVFGNFLRLQILDLSNNYIDFILPDTFRNSRKIQILNLAQNSLTEIAPETFRNLGDIRIVDLSYNLLRTLSDSLFVGDDLEKLDVSNNQLTKIPVTSLTNVAALTLCELDLSHNHIGAIHNGTVSITLSSQRLSRLDLSYNRLVRLEDAAFATLPNLVTLDLSNNIELEVYGRVFKGLENNLIELNLNNISIIQAPDLALPKLRVLKLSHNELPSIPPELAANLTSLRVLDLSENDLTAVPLITHSLPNLRSLSLAGNPITSLTNTSLLGAADTLEHLDIAHLQLMLIENGILNKFQILRSLRISTYPGLNNFNIPSVLDDVDNVRDLWIEAPAPKLVKVVTKEGLETYQLVQDSASDLRTELYGLLPRKIKNLTISGAGFNRLAEGILDGIQASSLQLTLHNTTLSGLPPKMFQNVGNVYNLSIEIDSNNKKFNSIPNPNSANYPNMADRVLLTKLNFHFTSLTCDCEIGWVEFWQRRKRQYLCSGQQWVDETSVKSQIDTPSYCDDVYQDDDLRTARCSNKNGVPLLEILKSELECGWSGASRHEVSIPFLIVFAISFSSLLF